MRRAQGDACCSVSGLRDENGLMYTPSIVRVGLNAHHSVQSVTMDNLVAQRMSSMERSAVSAGPRASAGMERDRMRIAILDEASIVGY
jgi:senataxin